jgi:DNA polymerase III delta prime subunit
MIDEHLLWVEKYRPHKIDECILSESIKSTFSEFVKKGEIPNMILSGGPGMGKTTVAKALCDELGLDHIMLNGSVDNGIDTLRTKISGYASAVSLTGGRKVIIIDEADYMNPNSLQPGLRGAIEEFAGNCSFILTCNYKNRIIAPIHSRCSVFDFIFQKSEKQEIAKQLLKRVSDILDQEKIKYDKKVVVQLIMKYFPDFRRILNELQRYSASGVIDAGIFSDNTSERIEEAINFLKEKDFGSLRKWVGQNSDTDVNIIMRQVYDKLYDLLKPQFIPAAVVTLGDWMYKSAFSADKEIMLMAFFADLMINCEFKE